VRACAHARIRGTNPVPPRLTVLEISLCQAAIMFLLSSNNVRADRWAWQRRLAVWVLAADATGPHSVLLKSETTLPAFDLAGLQLSHPSRPMLCDGRALASHDEGSLGQPGQGSEAVATSGALC
jgi:hypothetical protein